MSRRSARWSNWGGTATCRPAIRLRPQTVAEVQAAVRMARQRGIGVRAVGAGHSFTPLACTDGVLIDMGALTGVRAVRSDRVVRVGAGTPVGRIAEELNALGLRLPGLGTTIHPTVAGVLATGSHGGGQDPPVSQALCLARLVSGEAKEVELDRGDALNAARLHLGVLGLMTEVELRCEQAVALQCTEYSVPLDRLTADPWADGAEHVVAHWWPGRPVARLRVFRSVRAGRHLRAPYRALVARQYRRFAAAEYALPPAALARGLEDLAEALSDSAYRPGLPVEIRPTAGDAALLSPTGARPAVWVNLAGRPHPARAGWFDAAADALMRSGGKPHWGKLGMHQSTGDGDQLDRFLKIRQTLDPLGIFGTAYTDRLLGTPGA